MGDKEGDEDMVTLDQACAATGASRATLYRLMHAGSVTPVKRPMDMRTYVSLAEVRTALSRLPVRPGPKGRWRQPS